MTTAAIVAAIVAAVHESLGVTPDHRVAAAIDAARDGLSIDRASLAEAVADAYERAFPDDGTGTAADLRAHLAAGTAERLGGDVLAALASAEQALLLGLPAADDGDACAEIDAVRSTPARLAAAVSRLREIAPEYEPNGEVGAWAEKGARDAAALARLGEIADRHHLPREPRALGAALRDRDIERTGAALGREDALDAIVAWIADDCADTVAVDVLCGYVA